MKLVTLITKKSYEYIVVNIKYWLFALDDLIYKLISNSLWLDHIKQLI